MAVATNANIASLNLPHNPLTKITGRPSCTVVMELRKELCENAVSIRSARSGGQRGHLGMIVPANQCNAMNGAQPWVDPSNPGTLQLPADAMQHQITIATNTHNRNTKEWNTWIELSTKLKQPDPQCHGQGVP
jgi:hypothetical protein